MARDSEQWQAAPSNPTLADGVVHIWRASLDLTPLQLEATRKVLSADELGRAAEFHFDKDRNFYIGARGILRRLVGTYEKISPDRIEFTYNTFGKPALKEGALRFNASHSGGVGLFAFTLNRNIGVDLERIRPDFASRQIAGQFFSQEEISALHELPMDLQAAAFFRCWTRKEAFIKAHGSGLSLPLHQFAVSLEGVARLLRTDFDPGAIDQWTLHEVCVGEGFEAALAMEGQPGQILCFQWNQE